MNSHVSVDVKDLMLYQQLYIYFIPIVTNLGFINAFTVLVRLIWFRKHLKKVGRFKLDSTSLFVASLVSSVCTWNVSITNPRCQLPNCLSVVSYAVSIQWASATPKSSHKTNQTQPKRRPTKAKSSQMRHTNPGHVKLLWHLEQRTLGLSLMIRPSLRELRHQGMPLDSRKVTKVSRHTELSFRPDMS
jgi:hypothetical protein